MSAEDDALEEYLAQRFTAAPDAPSAGGDDDADLEAHLAQQYKMPQGRSLRDMGRDLVQGAKIAGREFKLGAEQQYGRAKGDDEALKRLQEEIAATRQEHEGLTSVPGKVGYWGTKIGAPLAAFAATKRPSVLTAAGMGAGASALEPTLDEDRTFGMDSAVANPVIGAASGLLGLIPGRMLAKAAEARLQALKQRLAGEASRSAPRDEAAAAAREAGYSLAPSQVNPESRAGAMAESIAGGKLPVVLQRRNQEVTDKLARRAMGLDDNVPLEPATFDSVRVAASPDYEAVRNIPFVNWDQDFEAAVKAAIPKAKTATKLGSDKEIQQIGNALLNKGSWTGDEFLEEARRLQELSRSHYAAARAAAGDRPRIENESLGRAYGQFADALENLGGRNLGYQGLDPEVISRFQSARTRIAISHDIERAMKDGRVDAKEIAKLYKKRHGQMNQNLQTIGRTATHFGKSLDVPTSGPISALEGMSSMVGLGGEVFLPGSSLLFTTIPATRIGTRYGISSGLGQRMFARTPSYEPGLSATLPSRLRLGSTPIAPASILGREYLEEEPLAP